MAREILHILYHARQIVGKIVVTPFCISRIETDRSWRYARMRVGRPQGRATSIESRHGDVHTRWNWAKSVIYKQSIMTLLSGQQENDDYYYYPHSVDRMHELIIVELIIFLAVLARLTSARPRVPWIENRFCVGSVTFEKTRLAKRRRRRWLWRRHSRAARMHNLRSALLSLSRRGSPVPASLSASVLRCIIRARWSQGERKQRSPRGSGALTDADAAAARRDVTSARLLVRFSPFLSIVPAGR